MKCTKAQELFSSYLENTVQPPMGVALEQHLAECDRCKAEYGRFHATTVVLDELPEVEPPADLHAMIMARVEEARRTTPSRVKWWSFDWQSALTVRVPAKAIAGCAAALLVLAVLAQFGPLHTVTASLLGGQRVTTHINAEGTAPGPLPSGFKADSSAQYVAVGAGLSVGVRVDSKSASSTVYMMRLATPSDTPVQVQVSMLPSSERTIALKPFYKGSISRDQEAAVPIVVTQSSRGRIADVAVVRWTNADKTAEEYVFLPSAFGSVGGKAQVSAAVSASGQGAFDLLDQLSADYGAVILAPNTVSDSAERMSVDAGTVSDAIAEASKQAELTSQLVGSSVYIVK